MIKNYLRYAVAAAFFLASGASDLAFAVDETELPPNDSISSAQRLVIGSGGKVEVTGAIGLVTMGGTPVPDVDFYSFHAGAGSVVTLDIDGGIKLFGANRSLNSVIAVFGPDGTVLRQVDDLPALRGDDAGSIARFDPYMENVLLPVSGVYTVGVMSAGSYPDGTKRVFLTGGATTPFVPSVVSNGSYTLIIEGVLPSAMQISIDIRPGATSIAPFNPKSKGNIPVALLSSKDFDAVKADRGSIKFGPVDGTLTSGRCPKEGEDVNGDTLPDLVCHFDSQALGFDEEHTEGMVTGTIGGMPFEGRGWLKVIPIKRKD